MRTSTYPALIAAFLAAFTTAAAGQKGPDVAGAYQLAGQMGGEKYSGSVTFSKAVGNMFEAAWQIGQNSFLGLCIRDDERLSCVSCPNKGSMQVVAYLDRETGLEGLTANANDKTLGTETLTSTGRKAASIAGAYTWKVTNPNGTKFQGIASVRQQDEHPIQVYTFTFTAPSINETAIGVSAELPRIRSDDLISVGECSGNAAAAIQYRIGYTPSRALRLTGIWAQDIARVRSFGTETLTSGNVPPQSSVAGLNVTPASIMGGAAATGTVTLSAAAPPGGANVVLTSNNATIATVPASMTIAAGAHIAPFTIATQHIRTSAEFVITASFGGQSRSAAITVKADTFVSDPPEAAGSFRVKSAPPVVADSVSSATSGCAGGCFDATGTEDDRSFSLHGPAVVNSDDGSRFQIVLGKLENEASYVSFARDPGGPPRTGTYAIADQCSEEPKATGAASFAAEFVTRAYGKDATSYLSAGGSLVIERAAEGRIAGRFNFTACRFDPEGKRHEVHVRGTFDGVR